MGPWPSRPPSKLKPGCWTSQSFHTNKPLGQNGDAPVLVTTFFHGENVDCDCGPMGLCPPGEPPVPPMQEFLNDPKIIPSMGDKGLPQQVPYPVMAGSHTFRPGGLAASQPYGVPVGSPHDMNSPWGYGRKRRKRGLEHLNSTGHGAEWDPGPDKFVPRDWVFPQAVVRAFNALEPSQQEAILHYWPAFGPIVKNLRKNFDARTQELDPRPVMAVLLADPQGPGGDVVRLMDRKWANFVVQCAWQSFAKYVPPIKLELGRLAQLNREAHEVEQQEKDKLIAARIQLREDLIQKEADFMKRRTGVIQNLDKVLDEKFPDVVIHEPPKDKHEPRPKKTPDELAQQYLDLIVHFQEAWKANLPANLSLWPREYHKFMIPRDDDPRLFSQTKAKHLVPRFLETAMNNVRYENASFVADIDDSVSSVYQQLDMFANANPYLRALEIRRTLADQEHQLDWSKQALVTVLNETLPQLQLTMNFFALSVWTGLGSY